MYSSASLIGFIAGTCTLLSMLPQIRKVYRTKRADDLSMGMLYLLLMGAALWGVYGILLEEIPIVLFNGVYLVLVGYQIALKWRCDESESKEYDTVVIRDLKPEDILLVKLDKDMPIDEDSYKGLNDNLKEVLPEGVKFIVTQGVDYEIVGIATEKPKPPHPYSYEIRCFNCHTIIGMNPDGKKAYYNNHNGGQGFCLECREALTTSEQAIVKARGCPRVHECNDSRCVGCADRVGCPDGGIVKSASTPVKGTWKEGDKPYV